MVEILPGARTDNKKWEHGFREFKIDPQAITMFALKSAVVVATVLAIPDAVALIPSVSTITSWILKLVACWTTALIAWFLFALGLMQVVRFVAGGIYVGENGIRMWRFGRLIPYDAVDAIALEPEFLFTAIFSYDQVIHRLTIYKRLTAGSSVLKKLHLPLSIPLYIPSYLFKKSEFLALSRLLVERKYGFTPGDFSYLSFPGENYEAVRRSYRFVSWQRFFLSFLIGLGVSLFLVRKACVLYAYNEGLREFRQYRFADASKSFAFSLGLDPTFAPGWHGIAGSQFNQGDFEGAARSWKKALDWKPDYVEAKVSLAYLSLQNRQFEKAQKLLESALKIDPYNSEALLNKADLELRRGRIKESEKLSRLIIAREEGGAYRHVYMARCLLAQARLQEGLAAQGLKEIVHLPFAEDKLRGGENLTYRLMVGSRIYLALGENQKALKMARLALSRVCNVDTLLVMAEVRIKTGELKLARNILERCRELMPENPWIYVLAAEINLASNNEENAYTNLVDALNCGPVKDANSLARAAELFHRIHKDEIARKVIKEVLSIDSDYPLSTELKKLSSGGS